MSQFVSSESSEPVFDIPLGNSEMEGSESSEPLLEYYRNYLLKIANRKLDRDLSVKVPASDIVQNTLANAYLNYDQFRGETKFRLLGWLRTILENELATTKRRFITARKRDIGKEVSLYGNTACGTRNVGEIEDSLTPSQPVLREETRLLYETAMDRIPIHYRQVIQLRSLDDRSFNDVAEMIGKSVGATQKLWARAIEELRLELLKSDPRYYERL
ncbi:ECF RNA polymerase sigma-E factor [Polystyrenella longa]|uniref:ECF RNA polymerase sigma-E factor n=1 Tax=Polystyrenella longa TaxID=2528007 RepID=A0A518CT92_9PLAN|nr:sigma-70 family RNA polymerase sigma factor [Polystyrenella longa]QDU82436.1 ECF RNA polymerase sigma-E factor [Polystyrenella longa]